MKKKKYRVKVKDEHGVSWWVNIKTGKVMPTNWKLRAALDVKPKEKK